MTQAKTGDTVKVHYTGTLDDGEEFDSSQGRAPLEFIIGSGSVIPGFESAVVGMSPGETRTVIVGADEAYGAHHPEAVREIGRDRIPSDVDVELGMRLEAQDTDGNRLVLTVVDVNDDTVTLDANHPLAGEDLTFEIELVEIV